MTTLRVLVNPERFFSDQQDVVTRNLLTFMALMVAAVQADLLWTFDTPDLRPGGVGGVYGYVYPSSSSPGKTPKHTASLTRTSSGGAIARLDFQLDGAKFPSAGLGLMFDGAAPMDIRGLDSITLRLRSDRKRVVRLSLASTDSSLRAVADDGVTFGRDTVLGPDWTSWTIRASDLSWPYWITTRPPATREEALSQVFALQFDIACEAKGGICALDAGFLELDDIRLHGVGGAWKDPAAGDCSKERLSIDAFAAGPARQNDLGGWWYAYTDRTSSDSLALGRSRILNATQPDSAQTWLGPDQESHHVRMNFDLERSAVWSGYAAIETQLAPSLNSIPQSRSYPGMKALSFQLGFESGFPEALGGVVVHLRKARRDFEGGRDHQVRIPWSPQERTWCLDLSGFQQPSFAEWIEPFSTDSLVALSFEVKLPPALASASSGFYVSSIAFHGESETGITPRRGGSTDHVRVTASGWRLERAVASSRPVPWRMLDPQGRVVATGVLPAGRQVAELPATGPGLSVLQVQDPTSLSVHRLIRP
jgi:hypothetical protein